MPVEMSHYLIVLSALPETSIFAVRAEDDAEDRSRMVHGIAKDRRGGRPRFIRRTALPGCNPIHRKISNERLTVEAGYLRRSLNWISLKITSIGLP